MSGLDQARSTVRFVSTDPVSATFAGNAVVLRDVSVIGAQIEHAIPVRPSMQGRLAIGDLDAQAVVVWTRLAEPGRYRSGLRINMPLEVIAAAIREMLANGVVRKGEDTLRRREQARIEREKRRFTRADVTSIPLSIDASRTIREARQWMLAHPDEAKKWYFRARATATEEYLEIAGSGRSNREDVLAVWEYLERAFDLRDVVRALE